jgi:hypothetical protein
VWPCSMCAPERTTEGLKSPSGSCVSYSNILSLTMGFYTNKIFYWSINSVMTRSRHIGTTINQVCSGGVERPELDSANPRCK